MANNKEQLLQHNQRLSQLSADMDNLPTFAEVTLDGERVESALDMTSYSGDNPLALGEDEVTIGTNTLIKDGLKITNQFEDVDPEVTEQEDIIAQIKAVLPYKGQPIVEYEVGTTDIGEGAELAANTLYLVTS